MRTVSHDELPEHCRSDTLIKSGDRKRQRRASNAIENTLRRCREIHAEQNKCTVQLRARSEKEGFSTGFHLFFTTLSELITTYEAMQNDRWNRLRQQLQTAVAEALHDPIIVERVVAHMQTHCHGEDVLTLVMPTRIAIPSALQHLTCVSTEDDHITLQCGTRALRFPIDALCQQWLAQAEASTQALNQKIDTLIPATLNDIIEKLLQLEQQCTPFITDEYQENPR